MRWAASLVRNAVGPSTSDPRTGEIIESDITWYHNHMRSYRNRLLIETGAANPAARTLEIPEDLMGETMRQVITHEVGHAIGLPHNMVASSRRSRSTRCASRRSRSRYGVSATIMDYARQNYVAQPGDGLEPKGLHPPPRPLRRLHHQLGLSRAARRRAPRKPSARS